MRSCANLATALAGHFEVWILTGDRDLGEPQPFAGILLNQWQEQEPGVQVYYAERGSLNKALFQEIITSVAPSVVYLNSMFSPAFSIRPLWWLRHAFPHIKVVLAPRGMLKDSALAFKPVRKKGFLLLARSLGWYKRVTFQATDSAEERAIRQHFGSRVAIKQLANFPVAVSAYVPRPSGLTCFIFAGRIHPVKGLDKALLALQQIKEPLAITIVGNIEDRVYYQQCLDLCSQLPENIRVDWQGAVPHIQMQALLHQHHFFLLPTHGENFGHAIFEAFAAGTPVLISDQTPWHNLEEQEMGWDLPLSEPAQWVAAIRAALAMDQQTYERWSRSAHDFAQRYVEGQRLLERYIDLFRT